MVQHTTQSQELDNWMTVLSMKLQLPILQLFVRLLGKPCLVIADYQESQNILVRWHLCP